MIASLPRYETRRRIRVVPSSTSMLAGLLRRVAIWWRTKRDRRALAAMSDVMLRDVGLTRADIDRELVQPFWQPVDYDALDEQRARAARSHPKGRARL
jgi:uncharacterized protein YjiS (DUF1127 family)